MELLPCPFCGGKATFDHDYYGWYWIVCEKCGTATNSRTHTMEDCHPLLAEQWNRRVTPLHEMLDDCRKQFDDWWAEFTSAHEDWRFADSDALRWQAWQAAWNSRAGPASVPEGLTLDAIHAAWHGAGVDIAGGNWKRFVVMLAAAPTPTVSEDRKDAERLNWLDEQGMIAIGHKGYGEYRYYAGDLFPAIRQVIDQARQEG